MALRLLLTFALYLRPSEADSILVKNLVRPVGSKRFKFKSFAIVLHPFERGEPSKVKSYDDTLLLDGHLGWLGPQLAKHAAGARATRKKSRRVGRSSESSTLERRRQWSWRWRRTSTS